MTGTWHVSNSAIQVQHTLDSWHHTCRAGARVAEPSLWVMGCKRGTAVSG